MMGNNVRRFLPLALLLALVVAGVVYLARRAGPEAGPLQASGTVAAVEVVVGPEMAGRVVEVWVDQGQAVIQGDPLFRMDDALLRVQQDRVTAGIETARAALRAAEVGLRAAQMQYRIALQTALVQDLHSRLESWRSIASFTFAQPPWYFAPSEELAAAQQEVERAEQALTEEEARLAEVIRVLGDDNIRRAAERLGQAQAAFLVAQDVLVRARAARQPLELLEVAQDHYEAAEEELEAAQSTYDEALAEDTQGEVLQARARVAVARARFEAARDRLARLQVGEHALSVEVARIGVEQAEVVLMQAQAALAQAEAELAALQTQIDRLTVRAPISGVVLTRSVEPGEVMMAGGAAMTLARLDQLTITVYLPEDRYGQVRLGDLAQVRVDSYPGEAFPATVVYIASRAEFTPRNVQTAEGRRTTVFAVELSLRDPEGKLKPGMPADVVFATR